MPSSCSLFFKGIRKAGPYSEDCAINILFQLMKLLCTSRTLQILNSFTSMFIPLVVHEKTVSSIGEFVCLGTKVGTKKDTNVR